MKEVNIISKVVGRSGAEASPSSAIIPNMSGYATKTELNTLRDEFKDFLEGADADVIINKWQDLVSFLEGISEDFDLLSMLGLKADKSELSNYVTLATKQTITGEKNFTGGLKVNGSPIVYDATNKYWKLEGDLLVTGGVTMYASDSAFTPSTIMDAIATDGVNLKVVDGVLTFVGKTGGGVADSVLWDNIEGKPSWIGSSKPSYSYSEIIGTPTLLSSFTNDLKFVSKGTTLSHYGITNAIGYSGSIIADKADAYNLAGYGTTGGGFPVNGGAIKVGVNNYQMILHGRNETLRFNTVEAGTLKKWRTVWHDGNFNPSNYLLASKYTASDILTKLLTVDGEGSGLNADLLDGLQPSELNVGSATKLQTPRTIWGQSFDGSGDVSGTLTLGYNSIIGGGDEAILSQSTGGYILLGLGTSKKGFDTYIDGYNTRFRYGTASTEGMRLTSTGNVLIGTKTDSGYKLDVNGSTQVRDQFRLLSTNGVYSGNIRLRSAGELEVYSAKIGANYTNLLINLYGGNVGIGTASPVYGLDVNGTLRATGDTTLASKLTLNGIPIYKSQDDVLYIDGNLAVRGGITMYATDAINVPSIIDALPIASASAKGIAAFNPNDFSIVDGYVSFIDKGGVDESVLADYAKKTDLSKYLPLSGGKVTGQIEYNFDWGGNIPAAGAISFGSIDELPLLKSFIGNGLNTTYNKWVDIISVRADNGNSQFGMYLVTSMTDSMDNLSWNRQTYGTWQGERVILDSVNWSQYISAGQVGAYLPQSGGNMSGHIFMTGAVADSSTANTSQLVFGTSANNHVCLTSNMKGLIINPSLNDTSGQIALYADVNMDSFIQSSLKVYGSLYASVYFNYGGSIAQSYGSSMYVWDNNLQINKTTSGNDYLKTMMLFDLISENIKLNINGKLSFNSYILWNSDSNNPYMAITYGGRDWYLQAYNNSYIYLGTGIAASIRIDTSGNLLTSGGITMYSDIRKKTKLQDVELSLKQIADAPLIEHYYNSDENRTTHVGSIAQYWAGLNDWFCKLDGEGFYTMEIQNAALASAISIARELVKYESKTDKEIRMLKDEVKRLKKEIKILKSA